MKNKKLKLSFLMLFIVFILSACGIKSNEKMKVDENFKGQRDIVLSFDQETMNRVEGGKDALKKFITENVKGLFEVKFIKDKPELLEVQSSIKFDSKEDYINKIKKLYDLGKIKDKIEVEFRVSKSGFTKGVTFNDNTDIEKIFQFLIDKAVEQKLIKESDKSSIWSTKTYNLNVDNKDLIKDSTYEYGEYSKIDYIGPKEITIVTSPSKEEGKFNRSISLIFDEKSYKNLPEEWEKEYFDGFNVTIDKIRDLSTQKIKMENVSTEDINKITSKFFGVETKFSMKESENSSPLLQSTKLYDEIPNNAFNKNASINAIYYVDSKEIADHPRDIDMFISRDDRSYSVTSYELSGGFEKVFENQIIFNNIKIETDVNNNGFSRDIIFPKEGQKDIVNNNLKQFLEDKKIKFTDNDDELKINYQFNFDKENEVHDKLLMKLPNMKNTTQSLFRTTKYFSEQIIFNDIATEKIEHSFKTGTFSKIINEDYRKIGRGSLSANVEFQQLKIIPIIVSALILLALIFGVVLFLRNLKKKNMTLKEYLAPAKEKVSESVNRVSASSKKAINNISKHVNDSSKIDTHSNETKVFDDKGKTNSNKNEISISKGRISADDGKVFYGEDEYI
ncbi:hypothetical protein ACWOAQ_07425 [Helcococcus kunzii]